MDKLEYTTNCVSCLSPTPFSHGGHVHSKTGIVISGFCEDHTHSIESSTCKKVGTGCYGHWTKEMGKIKR